MICKKHGRNDHARLCAEATGLGRPGVWSCIVCYPPAARLVEYGHIEYYDKREVPAYKPIPHATIAQLLRARERTDEAETASKKGGKTVGLGRSLDPGPGAKQKVSAGEDLEADVYRSGAGRLAVPLPAAERADEPAPEPAPKKVFIDASQVDLDAPLEPQLAQPKAKTKTKAKAKARAKRKPKPKPDAGPSLF